MPISPSFSARAFKAAKPSLNPSALPSPSKSVLSPNNSEPFSPAMPSLSLSKAKTQSSALFTVSKIASFPLSIKFAVVLSITPLFLTLFIPQKSANVILEIIMLDIMNELVDTKTNYNYFTWRYKSIL